LEFKGVEISWLGHAGFMIRGGGRVLVIDPYQVRARARIEADVVFVTHDHFDHLSPTDLAKVSSPGKTVIVAARNCAKQLGPVSAREKRLVAWGDGGEVGGVRYSAVPAYNVNKFREPGVPFHPKEYGGVGFVLDVAGVKIYHAGDTDFIPEMRGLVGINVALLPVSGVYVMTPHEAAEAASIVSPELAIPMHYGSIVGSRRDAEEFKGRARCRVEILDAEA